MQGVFSSRPMKALILRQRRTCSIQKRRTSFSRMAQRESRGGQGMAVAGRAEIELEAFLFGPFDPSPEMGGLEGVALRRAFGRFRVHGPQARGDGGPE